MGLPARQRRRLDGIEDKLRRTDPRLAAMFAIFGRLAQDEDMPRIEELAARAAVLGLRIRLWLAAVGTRLAVTRRRTPDPRAARPRSGRARHSGQRAPRPAGSPPARRWRPIAVFFPLALVLMSLSIYVAGRFGSAPRCVATVAVATAKLNPKIKPLAKAGTNMASKAARRCRPAMLTPIPIGR
jgi:hypothetical protein